MTPSAGCDHPSTIPIVYGMPGPTLMRRADEGEVALGGCMIGPPGRRCLVCGADLYEEEE